jgi:hypothetical protein
LDGFKMPQVKRLESSDVEPASNHNSSRN